MLQGLIDRFAFMEQTVEEFNNAIRVLVAPDIAANRHAACASFLCVIDIAEEAFDRIGLFAAKYYDGQPGSLHDFFITRTIGHFSISAPHSAARRAASFRLLILMASAGGFQPPGYISAISGMP